MLGNEFGKQLKKYVSDYVLFDLETTGISNVADEIIEISALKVKGGKVVGEFSTLVNPRRPIPYAASSVNNIFDDMVKDAPYIEDVLEEFLEFIGEDVLVGHNINSFDMKFIYRDFQKYFGQTISNDYVDTLNIAKICFPDWDHRRLCDLSDYFGIDTEGAHRALADCKMNQQVFEKMAEVLKDKEATTGEIKSCPKCGSLMKKRNGKYGEFLGCTSYPECRYTENI